MRYLYNNNLDKNYCKLYDKHSKRCLLSDHRTYYRSQHGNISVFPPQGLFNMGLPQLEILV